jgi:uncharacterized protein (TIGR03437 family)
VAVSRSGVLVSDTAHHRVLLFSTAAGPLSSGMAASRVLGQPDYFTRTPESADNRMNTPMHLALDSQERLYVADAGNNRVQIFNRVAPGAGELRPAVSLAGLSAPRSVAIVRNTDEIWVADGSRVARFPNFDNLARTGFQPNGSIPGAALPLAAVQDSGGALYIADAANRVAIHFPTLSAVNSASFLAGRALAPGAIASIFVQTTQFTSETRVFDELPEPLPMPRRLADVEVLVNGSAAPLFFVSPRQINFQLPYQAPEAGSVDVQVVRASTGQVLAAAQVQVNEASPALFTASSSGSGQVAAANEDGTINSPGNPARRGTVIALFGTGQGRVAGAPADGEPAVGLAPTSEKPRVLINNVPVDESAVEFSGLAPGFVGLWQINVRLPETLAPGNAIPIVLQYKGIPSNNPQNPAQARTTVAVR